MMGSQGMKIKLYFNYIIFSKIKRYQTKLKRSVKYNSFFFCHIYSRTTGIEAEHFQRTFSKIPFWILSAVGLSHFGNYPFKKANRMRITMIIMEELHILVCTSRLACENAFIN